MKKLTTTVVFLSIAIFGFMATPSHAQVVIGYTASDPTGGNGNINIAGASDGLGGYANNGVALTITAGSVAAAGPTGYGTTGVGGNGGPTRQGVFDFGANYSQDTIQEIFIAYDPYKSPAGGNPFTSMFWSPSPNGTFNPITDTLITATPGGTTASGFEIGNSSAPYEGGQYSWALDNSGLSIVPVDEYLVFTNASSGAFYANSGDGSATAAEIVFGGTIGAVATPEPSTLVLLGLGVLGMGAVAFRRRSIA